MADYQATNEERSQAASLKQAQNKARTLNQAGNAQKVTGKAMRAGGAVVDAAGKGIRKGGQSMMQAGAKMSGTGLGAIAGVPLMAVGGLTSLAGLGAQGVGKATKSAGRGIEKGGRVAKSQAAKLREAVMARRNEEKTKAVGGDGMVSGLAQTATGGLLKSAWINIIPSWGLTLIWINIHVFLSWIFSSMFCKLGDEWIPKSMSKYMKNVSAGLRVGESMGLVMLDLMVGIFIACIIVVINFMASPVSSSISLGWDIIKNSTLNFLGFK